MYLIEYTRDARRALSKMPSDLRLLIVRKIEEVAVNPHGTHNNVTRLRGRPEFRLRVQNWRVIYRVFDDRIVLLIIKVGSRGQVYQ